MEAAQETQLYARGNGFVEGYYADLGDQVRLEPYLATYMLGFNVTLRPYDDARVRQALVMSLDREVLTGKLLKGKYSPAYGIVPPTPGYEAVLPEWAGMAGEARHARARGSHSSE